MIFRKISEWITGRKRDDSRHPLDYINTKYGEPVVAPKAETSAEYPTNVKAEVKVEPVVTATPKAVNDQITDAVTQAPTPTKCGCGRSSTGFCVGLHKLTAEEWSVHADNPNRVVAESKPKKRIAKPKNEAKPATKKPKTETKPTSKKPKAEAKKPASKKKVVEVKAPVVKKSRARKVQ